MIQLGFAQLQPNTLLVVTDFAVVMALRAFQTKNFSVDGHNVNNNFVCVSNCPNFTIEEETKINGKSVMKSKNLQFYGVDAHHFLKKLSPYGRKLTKRCIMSVWTKL